MSGVGITPFIGPLCAVLTWHVGCQFFTRISDTKTHENQILGKLDTRFPFRNPELLKDFQKAIFWGGFPNGKPKGFRNFASWHVLGRPYLLAGQPIRYRLSADSHL